MLTVQNIFNDLAYSELSHTIIGNSPATGKLSAKYYPQVISALNLALKDIYSRLNLVMDSVIVHQQTGLNKYILSEDYSSVTGVYSITEYLEYGDGTEYFSDNLNKIVSIADSDGNIVVSDNTADKHLIKILSSNVIQINKTTLDNYTVEYRAVPPKVELTSDFDPKNYDLDIPDFIEEPILTFITQRLTKRAVKLEKGEISPRYTLLQSYLGQIQAIINSGLDLNTESTNNNFNNNGWI